jgi:hypothetical protein
MVLFTPSISLNPQNKLLSRFINLIGLLIISIVLIFSITYLLVIIFYKYNLLLPNFLNFNLIGFTIFIFSIVVPNNLLEGLLIDFIILLNKINYNNLEYTQNLLKFQEKYFSKFEGTYFQDKKCGEM